MVASNELGSNTNAVNDTLLNMDNNGINSANKSDNLQTSHINPVQSLLDSISSLLVPDTSWHQHHCSPEEIIVRGIKSLVTKKALIAKMRTDIRLRFKLTDAKFEQLLLA